MQPCFGYLPRGSSQSRVPSRELTQKVFTTLQRVNVPVTKKTQKIFQKSRLVDFSRLSSATCSRVEAPVARCTQKVLLLPSQLPRGWTFQWQKTLRQIFQILSQGESSDLVWRLICNSFQSQKSRVLRFKDNFKNFSIFPRSF